MDESEFLAGYDPRVYPAVAVTVDVVALTIRGGGLRVLLIRRGEQPHAGRWALPGGFIRPDEDLPQAAARELAEETGLSGLGDRVHIEQLASYGTPDRDPRMRVVSISYLAFAPDLPDPRAGTDAADAAWQPVDKLPELAFDHDRILAHGLERARGKLEYTPLATAFAGEKFTISELRGVYETVWGVPLHAGNFHRKILSVPGFVESTGETTESGGARGGPRAKLYRAGDARLLHPALLRPAGEEQIR
ncbi:NUDIX hydrolase [Streptosporangium sp. NBC_01755]|uniref:NUDIX hydrolase n=1 Tax=unclassified Streptosporangium TaxID=2632669 RepID=UPI002DDC4451|nr:MULTISPECIES: NUDIX domain-containing protein [unclassified Streptosporangium]WSA25733.1 NUDIX hydrolase [Streptosporangium sp. NBC_01810]WSD02877.1 NUDIX hydrolase [Streptosporangium sp. NBC_01755]